MRLRSKVVLQILMIIISSFLTLEIYARFISKQPYYAYPQNFFISNNSYGYGLSPNFKGSYSQPEFTISIDTNSDGLRDIQHYDQAATFRILALGDSFSFGIGVELADTYLSLLENMLNNKIKGKRYSVIKAGIPGYSTYNERVYLKEKGLSYHPDMVIIQFWWDDLGIDKITYLADAGLLTSGKIKNFAQFRLFLNRYFRSYALLRNIYIKNFKGGLFVDKTFLHLEGEDVLKNRFEITLGEFKKIETICKNNGIPCLFVLIPPKEFVFLKDKSGLQWQLFCNFLAANNIKYMDLMPLLKQAQQQKKMPYFKVDPHLNKIGHMLVAGFIYNFIDK